MTKPRIVIIDGSGVRLASLIAESMANEAYDVVVIDSLSTFAKAGGEPRHTEVFNFDDLISPAEDSLDRFRFIESEPTCEPISYERRREAQWKSETRGRPPQPFRKKR